VQRLLGGVSDAEARERLRDFTMEGAAANIRMPTLISHGADDHLMNVEGAKRLFDEIGAADKTLRVYEIDEDRGGGAMHCSHDYWAHNVPFMLDWLEDRL
jgi:pimeloyl-ACP methyl ester carboxylesterase